MSIQDASLKDKKVVFLCSGLASVMPFYAALKDDFNVVKIIEEEQISKLTLIKKRVKKLGWVTVLGQLIFIFLIRPILTIKAKNRIKEIYEQMPKCAVNKELVEYVDSANSLACKQTLQNIQPDVVIIWGTRIIKEEILNCIPAVFINIHTGITPRYRGVHGGYWALAMNDRPHCGVTVHIVDKGIDTGKVISQAIITPDRKKDNFETYALLQQKAALGLVYEAVKDILSGRLKYDDPMVSDSKIWSHPTLFQYIKYIRNK